MNSAAPAKTARKLVSAGGLIEALGNLTLALLWGTFSYAHVVNWLEYRRVSVLVLAGYECLFAVFFVARRTATATASSSWEWLTMIGGSFLPLLLRPTLSGNDLLVGDLLQIGGGFLVTWGILSLNRSVGLLPANRGVRRGGAYRLVRHPLYGGYAVLQLGYVLSNGTLRNACILVVTLACQLARIVSEERLLARDPEYVEYQSRTRWRLLPYVF
jgi:protein-S-isoprenylcysteine O-methyltransferase Ste14